MNSPESTLLYFAFFIPAYLAVYWIYRRDQALADEIKELKRKRKSK